MRPNNPANLSIWVASIHDREPRSHRLAFDAKEVLDCLGSSIRDYVWVITDLDCTGVEARSLSDAVEKGHSKGEVPVLSWDELSAACQKFEQTVEATIIGIPQKKFNAEELEDIKNLSCFPRDSAELIIRVVDSSFFEVITKNYDQVQALEKCFHDVHAEEPANYFAA